MARCQMDVSLLASYVGLARWRVRRHLRPAVFSRLKPALLARYADIFAVLPEMLGRIPDRAEIPVSLQRFEKDQSS
jgi:hypothetical protein